ncbi:hypothetical protein AGMMS49573_07350 [Endomicrobiia bacterium]|nr:hypothetical protein AGMMS49523_07860 [Endomicrobiia bacterium]GHT08840.1 hypothetical protein AGMMS49532_05010 [Endomicrobiia bacterium]GHT12482.1 hypothetical protein AGMMS49571_04530 [Endomicrobiia bacterium]GHT16785.1 hypothetical protein AGMMS49573_07350 [Endomicrobiia bacterium]GHT20043.1 hypothetical protein AGMMS49929_05350 [Endomicrobiia bacterium]
MFRKLRLLDIKDNEFFSLIEYLFFLIFTDKGQLPIPTYLKGQHPDRIYLSRQNIIVIIVYKN